MEIVAVTDGHEISISVLGDVRKALMGSVSCHVMLWSTMGLVSKNVTTQNLS